MSEQNGTGNGSRGDEVRFIDMRQFDQQPPPLPPADAPDRTAAQTQTEQTQTAQTATQTGQTRSVGPRHERTRIATAPPRAGDGATAITLDRPDRPGAGPVSIDYDFVLADDPSVWPDAQGSTSALMDLPERDRLPALETMLAASPRRLVIIVTRAQEATVRRLAAGARSLFDAKLAVVRIDRGPALRSAAALIGQVMTAAPPTARPAAEIIERLPRLCGQLGHLVLLKSVTKTDHPAVGFAHHLYSYLPGRRLFVLQTSPEEAIARVTGKGQFRPANAHFTPFRFDRTHGLTVAVLGPRPLPEELLDRLGVDASPVPLSVALDAGRYWQDADATEIVLMPQDVAGWVAGQLSTPETWPCRWCGEPLAAPIRSCPFCADTL